MGAFLENSLFFFVDDAEPIPPIYRSPRYDDPGRIVEVADVGCDTESVYPARFPRGAYHRRREGVGGYGSTRRIAEWRHERSNRFPRTLATFLNRSRKDRRGNYVGGKTRRNNRDYDDVYIADPDYDDSCADSYDDFALPKNDPAIEYKDEYYARFIDPRNIIAGHSDRRKFLQDPRYDCRNDDPESSFARINDRAHRMENTFSRRWFAEGDERDIREDPDIRSGRSLSSERRKRTKTLSRKDENLHRETEFEKARDMTERRERDDFPNFIDSKDNVWDSVSLENDASREELTDPTELKNRDGLRTKTSYNFVDSEKEKETRRENDRENLSSEIISNKSAKYQISKSNAVKKKSEILQSKENPSCGNRARNANSMGKNLLRPRSAVEGKKIVVDSISSEGKTEPRNARTNVDDRRRRVDKVFVETRHSARTVKRVADSNGDERLYEVANEETKANVRSRDPRKRTDVSVSRSADEKKSETTIVSTNTSPSPGAETEKRKFLSRLPVRTWKRLRTKEPTALRLDITNRDYDRKLRATPDIATTSSNDRLEEIKTDEMREEIRVVRGIANSGDIKRNGRLEEGSLGADKSGRTFFDVKNTKGLIGLSRTKGTSERQKKNTNIK